MRKGLGKENSFFFSQDRNLIWRGAKPQLYLDLTAPELSQLVAFDEVVIRENEKGDFVITIQLLTSEDLVTWSALDLSGAVVDGDQITLVVPASESVEFLRFRGGN